MPREKKNLGKYRTQTWTKQPLQPACDIFKDPDQEQETLNFIHAAYLVKNVTAQYTTELGCIRSPFFFL